MSKVCEIDSRLSKVCEFTSGMSKVCGFGSGVSKVVLARFYFGVEILFPVENFRLGLRLLLANARWIFWVVLL